MAVGEPIAPNSDIVMRIPGATASDIGRGTIDPTDYMGQSFTYQRWLDEKKKEIEERQQHQVDVIKDKIELETPSLKGTVDSVRAKVKEYQETPEYKKLADEDAKKRVEWNNSHGPVMGGSYQVLELPTEKFGKDLSDAKNEMDKAYTEMSKTRTLDDFETAKQKYGEALNKYENISKLNPASEEGKKIYKEQVVQKWSQGIQYATGWGQGGYVGTGKESIARADQMLANATGSKVGQATPAMTKTSTEVMKDLGYTLKENKDTGQMSYYDTSGKVFSGAIPGTSRDIYGNVMNPQYKYTTSGTADALTNMLGRMGAMGQRATSEQLGEAAQSVLDKKNVENLTTYSNLLTKYQLDPTSENRAKVEIFAANKLTDQAQAKSYAETLQSLKNIGGIEKAKEIVIPDKMLRVGTIMGGDIFTNKGGQSFVVSPKGDIVTSQTGRVLSPEDIADQRRLAGKTGEYNLYNFPGFGGSRSLEDQSQQAKQFLSSTFGEGANLPVEVKLPSVGKTTIEGRTFDVVESGGREYIKPETGASLIPLTVITELKNLATKSGEFKNDDVLYNQEMDLIRSFKEYQNDPESTKSLSAFNDAKSNAKLNPAFTEERYDRINSILGIGSAQAGTSLGKDGKFIPETNVAKGILLYSSRNFADNAVKMNILKEEDIKNPVVQDTLKRMPKYGNPIEGTMRLADIINKNYLEGNEILAVDPSDKDYNKLIDNLARASASNIATEKDQTFKIPSYMKVTTGYGPVWTNKQITSETYNTPKITNAVGSNKQIATVGDIIKSADQPRKIVNQSSVYAKIDTSNMFGGKKRGVGSGSIDLFNVTQAERKSKKSKPKADLKGKKSKKDISSGLDKLAKNISSFTISFGGKKKKGKVK